MHFVCVFGPPAVGKMTVGREITRLTGFKLFHNHMTVEPVLEIFEFGTPPFSRLVNEIRRRVIEEAIAAPLEGLVFTFVWALELETDRALVQSYVDLVEASGGQVSFVELFAPLDERLARNGTEHRLEHKRSMRDLDHSRQIVLDLDGTWAMNTDARTPSAVTDLLSSHPYVRIDNTDLPAAEVALRAVAALQLPRRSPGEDGAA